MLRYEEFKVFKPWSLFIKKLWTLDNLGNPNFVLNKSILPNACSNIAFIFGEGLFVSIQGKKIELKPGIYYWGQLTEAIQVTIKPRSSATMVQLFPWTPSFFINFNLRQCRDNICRLEEFFPDLKSPLTASRWSILYLVLSYFSSRYRSSPASDLIFRATVKILDLNGNVTVASIARDLKCSTRHLQKLFLTFLGLSPKELCLIVKVRTSIDDIAYPDYKQSFTALALSRSFYDQAHFNRAFKTIVKTKPTQFDSNNFLLSLKS